MLSSSVSLRPLTGLGALGLGNQRRMLQVRQLGPPPANKSSPAAAKEHRGLEHVLTKGPLVASNVDRPYQGREVRACGMEVGVQRARIILSGIE